MKHYDEDELDDLRDEFPTPLQPCRCRRGSPDSCNHPRCNNDYEPDYGDRNDDRDDRSTDQYSQAEKASNDRLDYATHVRESNDWRDAGEIRMGA